MEDKPALRRQTELPVEEDMEIAGSALPECFIEIERIGKYWKRTRTWSGYHEILKRKAGVLETQTVALATSSGEASPVLLVSPIKPVERPGNGRAPLRVPDMKHMKIIGPKPINPKQAALAESLVSENFGLFGALNEILRENSQLAHLQSDLAESLVMAKAQHRSSTVAAL